MKRELGLRRRESLTGYLYILPNFLGFLTFIWIPIIICLGLSFTDYNGFNNMAFTGLKNYFTLFQDDYFTIAFKNNMIFTMVSVPLTIVIALAMAVLVNGLAKGSTLLKTIYFFPYVTSFVAISIIWTLMFHPTRGPVNSVLLALGVQSPPGWLISSQWALYAVIIVMVWKVSGYYMVLLLNGLQSIPAQLYESARIDGAGKVRQFFSVTLPLLAPTLFFVLIMLIINSFQTFDIVYIMTEGGPGRATNILVYRIYVEAYDNYRFGYASAISMILFFMTFAITVVLFGAQRKRVTYLH